MSIWFNQTFPIDYVNDQGKDCLNQNIGITITDAGKDYLKGEMFVDKRNTQPAGFLHGGASGAFCETLASWAATFVVNPEKYHAVGLELNVSHMRPGFAGSTLTGIARPLKIGKSIQFWAVDVYSEDGKQICSSRVTMAVIEKPSEY
ncbi:MAG TPA: PaaI family thioesterase [Marinospirillum sp.]|uniref:PaaI family thioesterase n=1 Tax=Marinospirillum sp. TaxID=2183934 RepID=UPI002B49F210|nr:PaaI family thioesterase [Marinospirillum sp.]HKM16584.1 PaaI family thioesterase [Marinospirillum sp.]